MAPLHLRIRELRQARGWSQERLAEAARTNQSTISALETGKNRLLDLQVLDRIARALGVPAAELIERQPSRRK